MGQLKAVAPFATFTREIAEGELVDESDPIVDDHGQFFEPVKKSPRKAVKRGDD